MKDLVLHPCDMNEEIAKLLEEKNLTSFIKHPDEKLRKELKNDFYKGEDFSATFHSFHSVTINYTDIYLASHPKGYNEVVMIWDSLKEIRPLYFVFSLYKRDEYMNKLTNREISADDYIVVKFPYNNPRYSSFIIWNETVHCELTDRYHQNLPNPSFFVLEPSPLLISRTDEAAYGTHLVLGIK
jgi:hypothetical protein